MLEIMAHLKHEPENALALAASCKAGAAALEEVTGMSCRVFRAYHQCRKTIDCSGPYVSVRRRTQWHFCSLNRTWGGRRYLDVSRLGVRKGRKRWLTHATCGLAGLGRIVLTKAPENVLIMVQTQGKFTILKGRYGWGSNAAEFHSRIAATIMM